MNLSERVTLLKNAHYILQNLKKEEKEELFFKAKCENPWFVETSMNTAFNGIVTLLNPIALDSFLKKYSISEKEVQQKKVGLILAGNIPGVGFHDILIAFLAGYISQIKYSSQDQVLIKFILQIICEPMPEAKFYFEEVERLDLDKVNSVIATGSNNSSRYFESYFSKVPNIIRKNRTSVAFLTGEETSDQLKKLGDDIFTYFGLGCRNVSKLFVPKGYDFTRFFEAIESFKTHAQFFKFENNYAYRKSIYLVNQTPHLDNGFLLLKSDESFHAPIGTLYYEEYDDEKTLLGQLESNKLEIQCVVGNDREIAFGNTQSPSIFDFADNVDTLDFLLNQSS